MTVIIRRKLLGRETYHRSRKHAFIVRLHRLVPITAPYVIQPLSQTAATLC